jgi:hypothetical protein
LFSLQGLKNLGPTVRHWQLTWKRLLEFVSGGDLDLPAGEMEAAGYVVLQHAVRLDRPVKAYARWVDRIPAVYRESVLGGPTRAKRGAGTERNEHCLATLRNYRSLMPMAQDARKPMFDLRPADGAIGSHAQLVRTCRQEFEDLAGRIAERCGIEKSLSR